MNAARANFDDSPLRLGFRFAFFQDFGFRIQCVPGEQGIRQLDFVPTERKAVFADVGHAHSRNDGQRESAVDEALTELRPFAVLVVEMDLVCVVR